MPEVVYKVRMESVNFELFMVKKVYKTMGGLLRRSFSGYYRRRFDYRNNLPTLSKTMESGRVAQKCQTELGHRSIFYQNGKNPEKPPFCCNVRARSVRKMKLIYK
jgi:hypothetical protein